uniref:Nucleolus and neural progenitor protein-like N-terminal domain-containing protein n=1 Tax=Trichobilharzia regenti TaxID=157069 RepID=A0AA85K5T6_TRIRE|nr:unnamed protein product [Trichobilharzia regenti]
MESLNINFIPPRLYIACTESIFDYSQKQSTCLWKLRKAWSYQDENILLCHMIYIRFKNQLRHFLFFKSFSSVRRTLAQICDGPLFNSGIANYVNMTKHCKHGHCVSKHTIDHVLVCLFQLYKKIEILITRLNCCWRSCNAQFTTGHFTKVLLLIMSVISSLRLQAISSLDEVNCCYENILAVRKSLSDMRTWIPSNITLPVTLNQQTKVTPANEENHAINKKSDEQVQGENTLLDGNRRSVTEVFANSDAYCDSHTRDKFSVKKDKIVTKFSCDTQRSLASILPRRPQGKQVDLLSALLNFR